MNYLILKTLLLLVALFPADVKWQRITTDQHISFLFPNNSQTLKRNTNGIPSTIYQTKDLVCVYGVVCSDFSSQNVDMSGNNLLALYEEMRKSSLSIPTAILKAERTVPYDNMLIKEIEYSVINNNFEMTYFKRFIFRDKYVYQISIGGRTRHLQTIKEDGEVFFNSVNFN